MLCRSCHSLVYVFGGADRAKTVWKGTGSWKRQERLGKEDLLTLEEGGCNMATVWLTYAWADNQNEDVDFIAQELGRTGLGVKLDRWNIGAGRRLWDQITNFITSPKESDAWVLVATEKSLQSEACKEEFAYALDRALKTRGDTFPVIGLFLGPIDESLIPVAIRTRLSVSITDPDWKERIQAAAEGRLPKVTTSAVQPFLLRIHRDQLCRKPFAIEVRPRAGVWAPFIAGIPLNEKERVDPNIMVGPSDCPTDSGMLINCGTQESPDRQWWFMVSGNQATPTQSYYIWCQALPSELVFGKNGGNPQFRMSLR